MQKNQFRIVRVSMLLFVVATFSFAQARPFVSTNPSQILTAFQAARGNLVANIAGYANSLFGALAMIEFAWSAAVMVLEKADFQSFTAALVRKIMWIHGTRRRFASKHHTGVSRRGVTTGKDHYTTLTPGLCSGYLGLQDRGAPTTAVLE